MEYHKCKTPSCETHMSDGTPDLRPSHNHPSDPSHESALLERDDMMLEIKILRAHIAELEEALAAESAK